VRPVTKNVNRWSPHWCGITILYRRLQLAKNRKWKSLYWHANFRVSAIMFIAEIILFWIFFHSTPLQRTFHMRDSSLTMSQPNFLHCIVDFALPNQMSCQYLC